MSKIKSEIQKRYVEAGYNNNKFETAWDEYHNMEDFAPSGNVADVGGISDEAHFIMRMATEYYLTKAFKAMKIDLNDPNVKQDLETGNIGTPGRLAKVFCGFDTHDMSEMGSGRWNKEPRMASFPNEDGNHNPVFVTTRLDASCSHHFIRFGDDQFDDSSRVVIGYIPKKRLGGISKINRFVDWCARRFWLQEDLTSYIGKKIEQAFETDSVYVALLNIKHGCASQRGACDREAATTTVYMTGEFKTNPNLIPGKFKG